MAERIAAFTVLANCGAVWIDVDRGDVPDDDLRIGQIADGSYTPGDAGFAVDAAAVEGALSTSLFSSRGPRRLGWAHQTYAEFLAASFIARRALPLPQVRQFLVHPTDGKLVPQLRETAAWLAGMREEVFLDLIERDPEAVLRSAASVLRATAREALVRTLLERYDEGALVDRDREQWRHYHRLIYPNLARQLSPFISDRTHSSVARRVAIDIAEACGLRELVDDLVGVALRNDEDIRTRVNAAYAISRIGTVEDRARLKPLAYVPAETDRDDELKGCGLRATWPEHLNADELFPLLTPFRGNLFGAYRQFVRSDLTKGLTSTNIPRALIWVCEVIAQEKVSLEYDHLIDDIMRLAWEHLDEPGILDGFVPAALARVRRFDEVFGSRGDPRARPILDESDDTRRRVLAAALQTTSNEDRRLAGAALVRTGDVPWILDQLPSLTAEDRRSWAALLPLVLDYQDAGQIDAVLEAREGDEIVREVLAPYFDAVTIGSPEAQRSKEHHARLKRWQEADIERAASVERLQSEVIERIGSYLDLFEAGELDAWWWLNYELAVDPPRRLVESEYETDLTSLPGWNLVVAADQRRLIEAAERYVQERAPSVEDWLGTNTIHRPDWAGYRAFRLMWQEAPERLARLPATVWEAWATVVVGVHTLRSDDSAAAQRPLVLLAYQHAPERVLPVLVLLIEREDMTEAPDIESILWRMDECWDRQIAGTLLGLVNNNELKAVTRGKILQALLAHDDAGARALAESLLCLPLTSDAPRRDLAIRAASALLEELADAGWPAVWPAVQGDPDFGERVVARLIWNDRWADDTAQRLSTDAVADLYLWLARRYPHEEDVRPAGAHTVGFRERVGDWRDSLLGHLVHRGTRDSCEAVQRIAAELPHLEWLKWSVFQAQEVTRYRTWTPPSVEELRTLLQSPVRRLVQTPEQLLDVIMESLARLEDRLQQAEPPAAIDLWNEVRRNVFSPKNENQFSDYVARHLEQDLADRGVIVNREVVVRPGERTDIRVSVSRIDDTEVTPYPITVVIESKGCWNRRELDTGMEKQLCNRYMEEARTRHGVYLVGWFRCDRWNHREPRKADCPTYDIEEARRRFSRQAMALSSGSKYVRSFVMNAALR